MARSDRPVGPIRLQWSRVLRMALAGTVTGIALLLLPELPGLIPVEVRLVIYHPLFWLGLAIAPVCLGVERFAVLVPRRWAARVAAAVQSWLSSRPIAATVRSRSWSWAGRVAAVGRRADPAAAWLLGPLTAALGGVAAVFLLTWAPHYLTWPIWPDTDQFLVSALSWEAGLRPYRDLADFDFPGPIYLLYVLGKMFGWGGTLPIYAADLALLVLVGGAVLAWSRRRFGTWLPGLIGVLPWLGYYLTRDYSQVAQRDWHSAALVVLGLLALEAVPGRVARPLSALAFAAALACRPQPVLFLPAFLSAVAESARRPGEPALPWLRAMAWWSAELAVSLLVVFTPLMAAGVLDDFIRALDVTRYGSSYNRVGWVVFRIRFKDLFWRDWPTARWTAALALVAAAGPAGLRAPARTWVLALIGAFIYKPMSPVQHEYLIQPIRLVQSIALAPLAAWLLAVPRLSPSVRLAGLALLLSMASPSWPRYCTVWGSLEALGPLARGEIPVQAPPGCGKWFPRRQVSDDWDDYRRVLLYLRHEVDHRRPVANFFRSLPFPAVNGPTAHLSPFPAAGGCLHLFQVDRSLEARFAAALEQTRGTLVVWRPDAPPMMETLEFPKVEAVVRRGYRPCERFGRIEVWVRADEQGGGP